ncbi:multidrug resistance efflux pump [Flavobacterium limnosediminis JC2902]|uniref:Multidrug resistance efflux pump n=1 Tax=Flavobacterium limnosediminis JC2902 TaxID=1341181 RepID=V6SUS7_9FLAO|nr:HlyD family secretion protein [Flavobacterium limnosediminis]ESU29937.1 multidrug resistance efflux pump [Flavobacterium limnosediminis JC2902]
MGEESANKEAIQKTEKKRNTLLTVLSFIFLLGGVFWILSLFFDFSKYETTNNAQVESYINTIAARANGHIKEIRFEAHQRVQKGDTLVILDDEEYRIKVKQAEADLAIAEGNLHSLEQNITTSVSNQAASKEKLAGDLAELEKARKDYQRFQKMFADSAVTRNQYDQVLAKMKSAEAYLKAGENELLASGSITQQSKTNLEAARATVARKQADLDAAKLQLSYTIITAPIDGFVGERELSVGDLVNANQTVASIVLKHKIWVIANFKETQVERIKVGQAVTISIDALDDKEFKGKVVGFSPATGAKFSMVEPDNSTGNFVKITQRIPVKIEFEATAEELQPVKPGMNVTVEVKK